MLSHLGDRLLKIVFIKNSNLTLHVLFYRDLVQLFFLKVQILIRIKVHAQGKKVFRAY